MPTTCEEDLIPVVMDDCLIVNIETEQVVLPERPLAPLPNEEDLYAHRPCLCCLPCQPLPQFSLTAIRRCSYAQLGVYHSKIYRPVNSPERDAAFHRPAKSTDEEQAVAAGFLFLVRSYQERLVQEIVNYAHIHCISESTPAPSLPSLPLSASPSLSAPCMPSVSSPTVMAAQAGSYTTSFSPLASSASYTSLTTYEQSELEDTLSRAYTERHSTVSYTRPPPLSPTSDVLQQRRQHFQLPPPGQSYSLALPAVRDLDSDTSDEDADPRAHSDDGRQLVTPFMNSPTSNKDPKQRLLVDDHEQWARTRSDNGDMVVSAKAVSGDLAGGKGKGNKTKGVGSKPKAGRRKGEGGFVPSALIQTLPLNRELEDIKAQVEIDRVSSDEIMEASHGKKKTEEQGGGNDDTTGNEEEGEELDMEGLTATLRAHPMRTSKNLSFSASSIPAFVPSPSTSPDPNPTAPINLAQFIHDREPTAGADAGSSRKNESEASERRKVVIPTLPIRVRGATTFSTSDQPQPGSASPTSPSSPRYGGGGDGSSSAEEGTPQLVLSLRPSVPPLSSHLPQLAASTFEWTDMNSLKKLVCLFPVTQQKFISNFLFTQHFTMFTERLNTIFGDKKQSARQSNVITPRSAARFLPPSSSPRHMPCCAVPCLVACHTHTRCSSAQVLGSVEEDDRPGRGPGDDGPLSAANLHHAGGAEGGRGRRLGRGQRSPPRCGLSPRRPPCGQSAIGRAAAAVS
jgi:hypothetical protein